MDRLSSMTAFVRTVDVGSFAGAAAALGISPQMVAKHVSYLEARMGTRLLNRTTRKQSLTEIGRTYYDRCRQALAEVEWADALADEAKGTPRGRLRINAPVSFGAHSLVPVVSHYLERHPEVEVDLVLSDRFVDLVEEGFEAVFRMGPLEDSILQAEELMPFRVIACASPDYLRRRQIPSTPSDLTDHECVGYANWPGPGVYTWRFVRDGRDFEVGVRGRLTVNNAAALMSAALVGFGIVFVAEDLAHEALASGSLVRVLPNYETPSRPMHLLYHPDRRRTPKLRSFINAVMEQLGPMKTGAGEDIRASDPNLGKVTAKKTDGAGGRGRTGTPCGTGF